MTKQDYQYIQSLREFEFLLNQKIDLSLELINIDYAKNNQDNIEVDIDKLQYPENIKILNIGFEFIKEFVKKELNKLNDKYLQISFLNDCKNIAYEYLKDYFIVNNFTGGSYLMFYLFSKVLNVTSENIDKKIEFKFYSNKTIIIWNEPKYFNNENKPILKNSLEYQKIDKHFNQNFGGVAYSNNALRVQKILTKYNEKEFENDLIINNPIYYNPERTLCNKEYLTFGMFFKFQYFFINTEKFILKNDIPMKYMDKENAKNLANDLSNKLTNKQDFINFLTGEKYIEVKTDLDRIEILCLFKLLINENYFSENYLKNESNILYLVDKTSRHYIKGDLQRVKITSNLTNEIKNTKLANNIHNKTIEIFGKYFDLKPIKDKFPPNFL
jgi:hypothetical protein